MSLFSLVGVGTLASNQALTGRGAVRILNIEHGDFTLMLIDRDIAHYAGMLRPIHIANPGGSFLNAHFAAAIEIDTVTQVRLTDEACRISFPEAGAGIGGKRDPLVVRVALHPGYRDRLQVR